MSIFSLQEVDAVSEGAKRRNSESTHLCIVRERQAQPFARHICRRGYVAWRIAFLLNKKIRLSLSLMSVGIILFMAGHSHHLSNTIYESRHTDLLHYLKKQHKKAPNWGLFLFYATPQYDRSSFCCCFVKPIFLMNALSIPSFSPTEYPR